MVAISAPVVSVPFKNTMLQFDVTCIADAPSVTLHSSDPLVASVISPSPRIALTIIGTDICI